MQNLPIVKGQYKTNYNLSHLTWFKVGGAAEIFFKPFDTQDLADFLTQNQGQLAVTVIGAGSNIIIRDGGIEGVVVKLGQNFTNIELEEGRLSVGAGCINFNLAKFCQANSIAGFEFLIGIPGTIGGGVFMNAGSYGNEFKDIVLAVQAVKPDGNIITLSSEEIAFKYRGNNLPKNLIITKAIFKTSQGNQNSITALMNEINSKRLASQPVKERTGGSTFINPKAIVNSQFNKNELSAWQLIDQAGLRGYKIRDAQISTLHCNFMINTGNALASDLEQLGEFVRQQVFENSGIMLEWEIKRIGKYADAS